MKTYLQLFVLAGLSASTFLSAAESTTASSRASVSYDSPDKFTDFKSENLSNDKDIAYLCDLFTAHVEKLAEQYLPTGTHLEVRFKDIDLAGDFEPQRGPRADNIRFMRDIYPPRMTLEFRLLGPEGKVLAEGERKLSQPYYTWMSVQPMNEPFRYDRQLLTDWMRSEFKRAKS